MTQTTIRVKAVYPPKSPTAPWNVSVDGAPSLVRYNVWENEGLARELAARVGHEASITWQQGKPYTTRTGVTLDQRNIIAVTQPRQAQATTSPERPRLDTREEDIATLAIFNHMPAWTAQLDYCDSVEGAKVLDACRLMWRMHKSGSHLTVAPAAVGPQTRNIPTEDCPYDDEIPFDE